MTKSELIDSMHKDAMRLLEIIEELKARAKIMFPEVYHSTTDA